MAATDASLDAARTRGPRTARSRHVGFGLVLGALGVVFGDIGTSPLYALQAAFAIDAVQTTRGDVYGVISLVFWAITLIVSIKYVSLVMRANNNGEGGIMALVALVQRSTRGVAVNRAVLVALGVFGAALFYGDSVITPAISVLSAVEGLKVAAPELSSLVVPIALAILTALFAIQRWGTHVVGRLFGPVMVFWFATIAAAGLREIAAHPDVVQGLSPNYAVAFLVDDPGVAFVTIGAVVLAITGAEALYADMGHFGRRPISRAWFAVVFPALTLNYLGQAALILHHPGAADSPFFLLLPHWSRIPMVVLATAATAIASQAVISGAFSLSKQAAQLGFLPRLAVRHTSEREVGQIYAPAINWGLFVLVVALVLGFESSAGLAAAYGIAVSGTFLITTALFLAVARWRWRWPRWLLVAIAVVFGTVELGFFAANLGKVAHGGWLSLAIGVGVFAMMTIWDRGRHIVTHKRTLEEGPLRDFVDELHAMHPPLPRVAGTAVFLNESTETTPLAMRANVEFNHVLHERVVIVTVRTDPIPRVRRRDRVAIDDLGYDDDAIAHVTARFGFKDDPDIPDALRLAQAQGLECDLDLEGAGPAYFVSRITLSAGDARGLQQWWKKLFVVLARNAASPVQYFGLPVERTVTVGSTIEL